MRSTAIQTSSVLLSTFLLALPLEAQAFCILPIKVTYPQGPLLGHQAVAVYSKNLQNLSVGDAGSATEIEALKIAIDIINSAGTNAPRLYYAGELAQFFPYSAIGHSPEHLATGGISVQTDNCVDQVKWHSGNYALYRASGATTSKIVVRNGNGGCGTGTFWYLDPDEDGGAIGDDDNKLDVVGVLAHELLHALGLGHTNDINDSDNCAAPHPNTASVNSLMFAGDTYSRLWRRRLKRDDIEGLRYLYGAVARTPMFTESLSGTAPTSASWSTPTAFTVNASLQVNTPMSLSDATRNIDELQLAGFTNTLDEVRFLTGTWIDWSGNPTGGTFVPNPTAPTSPMHSWERVVVARGVPGSETALSFSREFVAWIGGNARGVDEDINSLDAGIHFRVRRGGGWAPQTVPPLTKYRTLGASYDPRHDVFVLAYIDSCQTSITSGACQPTPDIPSTATVFVRTVSATTGADGSTQAIIAADDPLAVGDLSCDFRSMTQNTLCKIPIAASDNNGPSLQLLEGQIGLIGGIPAFTLDSILSLSLHSVGAPSSAMNGGPANGSMLVGYTPTFSSTMPAPDGYARIFTMDRDALGALDGGVDNPWTFQTWFWPLHIGTMNKPLVTEPKWRAITY